MSRQRAILNFKQFFFVVSFRANSIRSCPWGCGINLPNSKRRPSCTCTHSSRRQRKAGLHHQALCLKCRGSLVRSWRLSTKKSTDNSVHMAAAMAALLVRVHVGMLEAAIFSPPRTAMAVVAVAIRSAGFVELGPVGVPSGGRPSWLTCAVSWGIPPSVACWASAPEVLASASYFPQPDDKRPARTWGSTQKNLQNFNGARWWLVSWLWLSPLLAQSASTRTAARDFRRKTAGYQAPGAQ